MLDFLGPENYFILQYIIQFWVKKFIWVKKKNIAYIKIYQVNHNFLYLSKCEHCENSFCIIEQKYFFNLPKIMVFAFDRYDAKNEYFIDDSIQFPMT